MTTLKIIIKDFIILQKREINSNNIFFLLRVKIEFNLENKNLDNFDFQILFKLISILRKAYNSIKIEEIPIYSVNMSFSEWMEKIE